MTNSANLTGVDIVEVVSEATSDIERGLSAKVATKRIIGIRCS